MKRSATLALITAAVLGGSMLVGGCASEEERVTAVDVWNNPTPELDSATRSWAQNHNRTVRTVDHNLRGVVNDFDRLMFLERPSGLVPYPLP